MDDVVRLMGVLKGVPPPVVDSIDQVGMFLRGPPRMNMYEVSFPVGGCWSRREVYSSAVKPRALEQLRWKRALEQLLPQYPE